ncbi:golgin subfamily A member 4 isoform X4 [Procambarus clarkii]|uniref:golgin subfamily A member 4 isoform X4 n=1 Tax=Procambarus clarkii TaxID=6728 RepID=UPI001E67087E|nr:cortactin-binding protein 2-like isoform X4 [Procambarus clarkii]
MIRRGSGRTPPFILVGLVLIVLILGFNYWTLTSQNADLQQEVEKLQAEVKISAMKQEQSENKNAALQETVHEMDSISAKLKKKLQEEGDILKTKDQDNQKKEYEITSLKNKIVKLQEHIDTITQQLEDHETELSKAKETNVHLATERDDAVEAIAEKDALINTLKRQLEQEKSRSNALQYSVGDLNKKVSQIFGDLAECQDKFSELETLAKTLKTKEQKAEEEVAAVRREKLSMAQPNIVPGAMNLPNIEKKAPYFGPGQLGYVSRGAVHTRDMGLHGITFHRELPILPRDPPNAHRSKPRFSVADLAKEPSAASQNAGNIVQDIAAQNILVASQPVNHANPSDGNLQSVGSQRNHNEGNPQLQAPAKKYSAAAPEMKLHSLARPRYALVTQAHVLQHPRVKPVQGPAVVEQPVVAHNNRPIAAPINPGNVNGQDPHNDVLAPPPQHHEDSNVMNTKGQENIMELNKHLRETENKLFVEEVQNARYHEFQDGKESLRLFKDGKHQEKVVSQISKYHQQHHQDSKGTNHALKRINEPEVQHKDDTDHNDAQEQIDEPQAREEQDDTAHNNAQEQIDEPQAREEQDDTAHNNAQEQIDEPQAQHEQEDENHNNGQEQLDVPEISQTIWTQL